MGLVKGLIGGFGLFVIVATLIYGHSDSFKAECLAHKLVGYDMGAVKNLICDVEFDIKTD